MSTGTIEHGPEAMNSTAPPTRTGTGRARRWTETSRTAVTEVLRPVRPARPTGGGSRPPRPPRLRRLPTAPRPKAPRDTRWWAGAGLLAVSLLLVAFVAQVAVVSSLQHHRAQTLAYDTLRTTLAKAEAPIGQLDLTEELVPAGTPVGLLEIPSIGLSETILEGTSSDVLRSGAGHRRDSVMPGQAGTAVVLGRQVAYGGPFGSLARLQPGDIVKVTTGQGDHEYRVVSLRRAGDPMPEELRAGQGRLELQTADGLALFPSGVLHVDAELISETQANPSRVMGYAALPAAERAMGQASGGWFAVFFALVFFTAAAIGVWWLWTSWGRWHAWLVGVPVLLTLGVITADTVMDALPNLL
ncbi:sortase [Salinibacterium sp. ZJ454]|uniref:sortase n=1 Tax=Salinibacterium sp. ZJ454 TaxID=2708339 RepID=UPI001423F7FD|nr:sortase [Salinibacterium sp. ZJ454]